jgi:hypothetical protein
VRLVSRLVIKTGYRARPVTPQEKEWTTIYEAMTFAAFNNTVGGLGKKVFEASVASIARRAHPEEVGAVDGLHMVPAAQAQAQTLEGESATSNFVASIDWHALVGSRIQFVRKNVFAEEHTFPINLMAILVGAEESLTFRHFAQTASMCDYTWMPKHPALPVAQFLPSLLSI